MYNKSYNYSIAMALHDETVPTEKQELFTGVLTCKMCSNGDKVTVDFEDATYTFHTQWLHDARCDDGAARNAETAICQQSTHIIRVNSVQLSGKGLQQTLDVTWDDGKGSNFPVLWLRVMAPIVAARAESSQSALNVEMTQGWTVENLKIPEVSYHDLFDPGVSQQQVEATIFSTIDKILSPMGPGLVKIVDLPAPSLKDEHCHVNNLVTSVLKRLFGSVFVHPIRGSDQAFSICSYGQDSMLRKADVPNYDTNQLLLPHTDHAFYQNPIRVQGFYGLEGLSENTWVSADAALATLQREAPEAFHYLCNTPLAIGRVSHFYGDPLHQAATETAITLQPGSSYLLKSARWHPNLTGSLLAPFNEYENARLAHQKFQDILRRDTHQLKVVLKPGDMYLMDNFRLLHGREKVLQEPRTGVGQTVPEQVAQDRYRCLCVSKLKGWVEDKWLVHLPMPQLRDLVGIVDRNAGVLRAGDGTSEGTVGENTGVLKAGDDTSKGISDELDLLADYCNGRAEWRL